MPRGRPRHDDILTPREWEVLALIRKGRTNEQIAAELGISESGAKYHVAAILSKLGVSSRHEAAKWRPEGGPRWSPSFAALQSLRGPALVMVATVLAAAITGLATGVYLMESRRAGESQSGPPSFAEVPATPEEFLLRVEAGLRAAGDITYLQGTAELAGNGPAEKLWSVEAWFDLGRDASRASITKAPTATLDMAPEQVDLVDGEHLYRAYPASDEQVNSYLRKENPSCFVGEPDSLIMPLLCGFAPIPSTGTMEIEGLVPFEGRMLQSLVLREPATAAGQSVNRLLVDPSTYVPVAHSLSFSGQANAERRTLYHVQFLPYAAVPVGFFDPASLGYESVSEQQLRVLDDPDLSVPVYWPGRQLTIGAEHAYLSSVEERSPAPQPQPSAFAPDTRLTLVYRGDNGSFRLDYWPPGKWEEMQQRLGQGFPWAECSEQGTVGGGLGETIILRGFDTTPSPLAPPSIATPSVGAPQIQAPSLFPDGCPDRPYDRFMAVIHLPQVTVTVNAPYGRILEPASYQGVYNSESALEAIARSLRLRQPGE